MTNTWSNVNETLAGILTKNLERADNGLETAIDFTIEQVPLIVQEYLTYNFWFGIIMVIFSIILSIILLKMIFLSKKFFLKDDNNPLPYFGMAFSTVGILICLVCIAINLNDVLKIKLAPRVYLIEKAASLVNSRR
jgi:hypothetical protein